MLKKLKITTYVFILCLFGLTLITVSSVFANSPEFNACKQEQGLQKKKNCFKNLALALSDVPQSCQRKGPHPLRTGSSSQSATTYCLSKKQH
jgi:hypothetical protein